MTRLPRGTVVGLAGARRIAADPVRLRDASAFWRRAYLDLGFADLTALDHDAITFASAVPDDSISTLHPERDRLIAAIDDTFIVRRSGCLTALDELAVTVTPTRRPDVLLDAIEALLAVETGAAITEAEAVTALLGVRELFDAVRRYRLVSDLAGEFTLPFAEMMALYRQETGLCIAPPAESYAYAPLIRTGFGCRTDAVSLRWDPTCTRPGFNIVYGFQRNLDANRNDPSIRFDLAFRNLLVLAGLDAIVLPRLPPRDELRTFWQRAIADGTDPAIATLITSFRTSMLRVAVNANNVAERKSQRALFDELCQGIARVFLDGADAPPEAGALVNRVRLACDALMGAHDFEPARPVRGTNVKLRARPDPGDAQACLRLQASWYASRRVAHTLYAWQDRVLPVPVPTTFPPFLAYLRFHTGDAIFVGMVLRVLARMDRLLTGWRRNAARWGTDLPDAVALDPLTAVDRASFEADLRGHWATRRVAATTAWHQLGLIDVLNAQAGAPAWVGLPPRADRTLGRTAAIARRVADALAVPDTLNAVVIALERTPASWLVRNGFASAAGVAGENVYAKAHSFERLRLVYQDALTLAGL